MLKWFLISKFLNNQLEVIFVIMIVEKRSKKRY